MAVIAIFCDGTWNSPGAGLSTHVLREADACARMPDQIVLYFPGVGTGTGMVSELGRRISRIGGGLFGWGLNRNIRAAYLELCRIYQPGDRIMIFGFSRGAYTARSLVGMIRKCGILEKPARLNAWRAFRLYRRRGAENGPDAPDVMAARRRLSPGYATSQADIEMRADGSNLVRISYLGVWDTVGALGIPQAVLGGIARAWNRRYQFHDTSLSRLVEHARHAVALDERRVLFEPSLWDNLDQKPGDPGLNRGDQGLERPYQQVWFAGNHSIVGGAVAAQGLAAVPARFVMEEAERLGLQSRRAGLPRPDATGPAPDIDDVRGLYRFFPVLLRWRAGPQTPRGLHPSVLTRMARRNDYRPGSLRWLFPELFDGD
ncbi:DUF2235 domain-containing protein [uncultured Roseobacter sp.]|uniref:DUF2235 domain-containing protein n=1 Tax=uncultured Roseobacter sp. TaxID=114847 RepID=UPI00261A7822|nr:DUF2235 domain-containing protein [uncultured Roseobacter sp.]